jgi:hypothetical protein
MIELILTAALFGGCSGGSCATVQKEVTKTRTVLVQRDAQPVKKAVARVRTRVVSKHRLHRG